MKKEVDPRKELIKKDIVAFEKKEGTELAFIWNGKRYYKRDLT